MAFRFEHLEVWQYAVMYSDKIYSITKSFPKDEQFGLTNQLRRAASSVSANIAEGSGSVSKKDFCHYLDIAIKSLYETVSFLYVAKRQKYLTEENRVSLYKEAEILVKKLQNFKKSLRVNTISYKP